MIFPVILCGGSGSRLWPLSRASYPKQFIDVLADGYSMLQSTVLRLKSLNDVAAPLAICNHENRFFVAEQFQQLGIQPANIILEPEFTAEITLRVASSEVCLPGSIRVICLQP